jgi:hypothetical protein
MLQGRVDRTLAELLAQLRSIEPSGALIVWDDVGYRVAVVGEDYALSGRHGIDDARRSLA